MFVDLMNPLSANLNWRNSPQDSRGPCKALLALETKHESRAGMGYAAYCQCWIWRQTAQMRKTKAPIAVAAAAL